MKKNIFINLAGIAGGQAVALMATPILARIYTPSQFGEYAFVLAVAGVIATVAALRFDVALPAVPEKDVKPLLQLALTLSFIISCLTATVIFLLSNYWDFVPENLSDSLLWIGGVAIVLAGTNVCQAQFTRAGDFKSAALLRLLQPTAFVAFALMAFIGLNGALLLSWMFGLLFGIFGARHLFSRVNFQQLWAAVRRAYKYPVISAPMALLDTASLALPLLFIASYFGDESAGNYSQVQRLLAAPLTLFGMASAQVFYKHAGDVYRQGNAIEPLMWRMVYSLFGLALFLILVVYIAGEPLMDILLGDGWRTDREFLLLAIAPVLMRMSVSPISCVFLITNRIGIGGMWQGLYFIVTVSVIVFARGRVELDGYLVLLACSEFVLYSLYLALAVFSVRIK